MSSFGRFVAALILAGLILFPGVELLRYVVAELLGIYPNMTYTDCLLFFVIVLLCALFLQRVGDDRPRRSSKDPGLRLAGNEDPRPERRTRRTSSGRTRSREPSRRRPSS